MSLQSLLIQVYPSDIGLKNIIDKLAEFVARNGPEFEIITKTKQQGNPKFSFLYGGEYYRYYQWCVSNAKTSMCFFPLSEMEAHTLLKMNETFNTQIWI